MAYDPFAVSDLGLSNLPAFEELRRADFGTDGANVLGQFRGMLPSFGAIWVLAIGGQRSAERFVRNCFDPKRAKRAETNVDLSAIQLAPGERLEIGVSKVSTPEDWHVPRPATNDLQSAKLALATVVHEAKGVVRRDVLRVLPVALGVADWANKRAMAIWRASCLADLLNHDLGLDEAIKILAEHPFYKRDAKARTIWKEWDQSTFRRLTLARQENLRRFSDSERGAALRAGLGQKYPHATDEWFDEGLEDRVAQRLLMELKAGKWATPPKKLMWDVFNLIDGFSHRRRPISVNAQVVLDYALGLVDREGKPRLGLQLGGILRRGDFVRTVYETMFGDDIEGPFLGEIDPPRASTLASWKSSFLWTTAEETIRASKYCKSMPPL